MRRHANRYNNFSLSFLSSKQNSPTQYHLAESSTFTLEKVDRSFAGTYQCMADNGVREAVYADIELTVLCKLKYSNFMCGGGRRWCDGCRNRWIENQIESGSRASSEEKRNEEKERSFHFFFLSEFTFIHNSCRRVGSHLISSHP